MQFLLIYFGCEIVCLGWEMFYFIFDLLWVICNCVIDCQLCQCYYFVCSFWCVLDGWCQVVVYDDGGFVVLLLDKLQCIGYLLIIVIGMYCFMVGLGLEVQYVSVLLELVFKDMVFSLELVCCVNNVLCQSGYVGEMVLNMQCVIQMLGLDGLQQVVNVFKFWLGLLVLVVVEMLCQLMVCVGQVVQVVQVL